MPLIAVFVLAAVVFTAEAFGWTPTEFDVAVTRDPTDTPLPTRADYLRDFPELELDVDHVERRVGPHRDPEGVVVLVVNTVLHRTLEERFDRYAGDMADEGYEVVMVVMEGGTPQELKDIIVDEGGDELVGSVLAGELPLAWFEQREHFYHEDEPDNQRIVQYPIDLFYMDLDGVWEDTSGNGVYDYHHGSWAPDIWLGRLPGYNLSRIDEDTLIAGYLDRVHDYRAGDITLPHRALNFIDDDWRLQSEDWSSDIYRAYGRVFTEVDPESTSASGYRRHLLDEEGYELVQVAVHSTADAHLFKIHQGREYDYFRFRHLRDEVPPNVLFFNLFACSSMNISRNLCMGALYALRSPCGLGAVGSSKTGSMLFFEDYYRQLDEGLPFGEALRRWFVLHGREPGHENWARSWFYGMTHFGDPTLTIPRGLRVVDLSIDDRNGDHDRTADAGERVILNLSVMNRREAPFSGVSVELFTVDPHLELLAAEGFMEAVGTGETVDCAGFEVIAGEDTPDLHRATIDVRMSPRGEEEWWDRINLSIRSPRLELVAYGFGEIDGDGDGWVGPGESGVLTLGFCNRGGDDMHRPGVVRLTSCDGLAGPDDDEVALAPIVSGGSGATDGMRFHVSRDAFGASAVFMRGEAVVEGVFRGGGVMMFPITGEFDFADGLDVEPVWGTHYPVSENYADVWRWAQDAGEDGGGVAFGGPDSLHYPPRADAAFELPLVMMGEGAVFELRHRMDIEPEFDAAVVEVDRGAGWERVEPEGGYNGVSVDNGSFPGGDCWNGTFNWTDARFRIPGSAGPLRIRLRFASDGGVEGNGWFIDRLGLSGTPLETSPSRVPVPRCVTIERLYPNPFNRGFVVAFSLPEPGRVVLGLFDINGRKTATLFDGLRQAGSYTVRFDTGGLASGVYWLRLGVDGTTAVRKAVSVK